MSKREVIDLAERALFWIGGLLADVEAGKTPAEVIAKGRAHMTALEVIRWSGKTRDEVQKKLDQKRRRYQSRKLKLSFKGQK